jgi:hypothetical protein
MPFSYIGLIVEKCKAGMAARQELRSNVDWLSEVVKALSTAWHNHEEMGSLKLKTPLRQEKVRYHVRGRLYVAHRH